MIKECTENDHFLYTLVFSQIFNDSAQLRVHKAVT